MLGQLETYAVLPARDLNRAKTFYRDALGMEPVEERAYGLVYRTPGGSSILMYETENAGTAQNTALCWDSPDLEAEMAALRARGVVFEEYDFPGLKTENGIASTDEDRSAWFKDTEGNILCVAQTVSAPVTRARTDSRSSTRVEQ